MDATILSMSNMLISGRQQTSPTFTSSARRHRGFATSHPSQSSWPGRRGHVSRPGMTFANHGAVWELDHSKIPRKAYDLFPPCEGDLGWGTRCVKAISVVN